MIAQMERQLRCSWGELTEDLACHDCLLYSSMEFHFHTISGFMEPAGHFTLDDVLMVVDNCWC